MLKMNNWIVGHSDSLDIVIVWRASFHNNHVEYSILVYFIIIVPYTLFRLKITHVITTSWSVYVSPPFISHRLISP